MKYPLELQLEVLLDLRLLLVVAVSGDHPHLEEVV